MSLDLSSIKDIVTIIASFGTMTVAIIALYNVRTVQRQLRLTEKQAVLNRSSIQPCIRILSKKYERNSITLEMQNKGKGPATKIGLCVQFWPLAVKNSTWDLECKLFEIDGNKKVPISNTSVFIPLKAASGQPILLPEEKGVFCCEKVVFWTKYKSKEGWHIYNFDELKEILAKNQISFMSMSTALVYSDFPETNIEFEGLINMVIDFHKHKSISDAFFDNKPLPNPPQATDIFGATNGIAWQIFKDLKSNRAFIERDELG